MENEVLEEQPSQQSQAQNEREPVSSDGSFDLGKFKDQQSLLEAYNNLQAEFTRKCQKLSQLEKEMSKPSVPVYQTKEWQQKVSDFLSTHVEAKQFASEISQKIIENPNIYSGDNALNLAYAEIISKKYRPESELINDDKFVNDYVINNEQIKKKVLQDYINGLRSNKLPPIQTSHSGKYTFPSPKVANSLSEAKKLVEDMLKAK